MFEELAGAEEGALMTRVFFSSWRPVYRPAGGMLRRARRNHLLGPTAIPPALFPDLSWHIYRRDRLPRSCPTADRIGPVLHQALIRTPGRCLPMPL